MCIFSKKALPAGDCSFGKWLLKPFEKKVLFVIVIFCLFPFCQRKTGAEISNEAYSINIQDNTTNNIKRLSDLIDTVIYTPLQPNDESVVGKIDRIKFYNNKIFICDRMTNTIFIFKEDGAYLYKNYDGPFYTLYSKSNDEAVIYTNEITNDCFKKN